MAPLNTTFSFVSPVEGGAMFLSYLKHPRTLYPGAYTRGFIATKLLGPERGELVLWIGARTHTGATGVDLFTGGGMILIPSDRHC